jgi:hypothetical protein
MIDPTQLVKSTSAALSLDGHIAELQFVRGNGKTARIHFPMDQAGSIILSIEEALGQLFDAQREMLKGQDPRAFFPLSVKRVSKVQGAVSAEGTPVLSLVLSTGVRLDLSLDQTTIPDLIAWLEDLAVAARKGRPALN